MGKTFVKDDKVFTVWKCEECSESVEVNVGFFQDNGTPVCCDRDAGYKCTYILHDLPFDMEDE